MTEEIEQEQAGTKARATSAGAVVGGVLGGAATGFSATGLAGGLAAGASAIVLPAVAPIIAGAAIGYTAVSLITDRRADVKAAAVAAASHYKEIRTAAGHLRRGLRKRLLGRETNRIRSRRLRRNIPQLLARDGTSCAACQLPLESPFDGALTHVDHVIPFVHGGSDEIENLQLLHARCNVRKGSGTMANLRKRIRHDAT